MAVHDHFMATLFFVLLLLTAWGSAGNTPQPALPHISPLERDPFAENHAKNFSWDDPELKRALWSGIETMEAPKKKVLPRNREIVYKVHNKLSKRASDGIMYNYPTCLSCAKKAGDSSDVALEEFRAENLLKKTGILANIGSCVFYTQRPKGANPRSLSGTAQTFVCGFKSLEYRSIWDMWPASGCSREQNYYCLNPWDPGCCWLNEIFWPANTVREERILLALAYFQQMSKAMALSCTGDVYVLTDFPDDIEYQVPGERASIWITHELPTLRGLYQQGVVKSLQAIPVNDQSKRIDVTKVLKSGSVARGVNWPRVARSLKEKREEWIHAGRPGLNETSASSHRKRICSLTFASQWEQPGEDYFG